MTSDDGSPEQVKAMKDGRAALERSGAVIIDD